MVVSSLICVLMTAGLVYLPPTIAGPMLIAIMVPWGIVGLDLPACAGEPTWRWRPSLLTWTLPLNASAMYFGVAAGTFLGGWLLKLAPASDLGLGLLHACVLAGLLVLFATARQRRPALAPDAIIEPGE